MTLEDDDRCARPKVGDLDILKQVVELNPRTTVREFSNQFNCEL